MVEQIYESHIKKYLLQFLNVNNIIDDAHYGEWKGHRTTTATIHIYNMLLTNKQNDNISVSVNTDRLAAFDTVDIPTLLRKLEHYG